MAFQNQPLITIQIPTYSQKEYVTDAVRSALEQTYENLEVIVCDDNSPDYDIFERLREFNKNPKLRIIRNEKNLGRVANYRNLLFNHVKGQWFVNLDGDDFFTDRQFIERAVPYLNSEVAAYQAGANLNILEAKKLKCTKLAADIISTDGEELLSKIYDTPFTHASVIFNTEFSKRANFYNINVLNSDYFSFLKILKLGKAVLDGAQVYHWRIHEGQASHTLSYDSVVAMYLALDDLYEFYKQNTLTKESSRAYKDYKLHVDILLLQALLAEPLSMKKLIHSLNKLSLTDSHFIFLLNYLRKSVTKSR